jgi:methyltransferase-like protein/2-polyprenyl-3-methyl-5-hydroxy-6-metoxy-1,4-benzoquinol methylase
MEDYDYISYESLAFADTHPDRLAVLGQIFGLQPTPIDTCRVLELGCAEGGNLIPMAWSLPNAQFVGIDLSVAQTKTGSNMIAALGLGNIVIQQGNILDLTTQIGTFDYIIAHGVLSWVDAPVREKLMASIRELLSDNGLAYVSYNVNPGWRLRGALRDLMLYHVRDIKHPLQRLERTQELLRLVEPCIRGAENPLARYMTEQIKKLASEDPSYLYHEYLESTNQPMLFSEFVGLAKRHAMQYVCDSELYTMFGSSLGEEAATFIERFETLEEQEQYMDFLRGRGFRQSIICHENATPNYDIDLSRLEQFSVYADVMPSSTVDLRQTVRESFVSSNGEQFSISDPLTKASLRYLGEVYPNSVPLEQLRHSAVQRLPGSAVKEPTEQSEVWLGELFNLFANGAIGVSTQSKCYPEPNFDTPMISALGRMQAENGNKNLTTVWHSNLDVDAFALRLIHYLDGVHSLDDIVELMTGEVNSGSLVISSDSLTQQSVQEVERDTVKANCERLLMLFARHGLIASAAVRKHGHVA